MQHSGVERTEHAVAWVVPGPLRQLTGGYLYDARIVDGLRSRGWTVGLIDIRSTRWPLDLPAGRRLVRALRRQRWAAVVLDELAHPAIVATLIGGRLRRSLQGAPLILLVHHLRSSEPASWLSRAAALLVESLAMRAADLVICTSETTARTVRPLVRSGVPVEVVRPGWDTHVLAPPPARCAARTSAAVSCEASRGIEGYSRPAGMSCEARYSRPAGPTSLPTAVERGNRMACSPLHRNGEGLGVGLSPLRLLLVGHWTPRKNILVALAALARVDPGVTLDLVGEQDRDPTYAEHVRSALRDPSLAGRVRIHGRVPDDLLAGLYAAADALLLPSTHEGYGMVLAEALAAGLPIVATRVGAVPEVVRDGFEAELAPPGDVAALARAIERLAVEPAERQRRARLARERSQTLPRWSESVVAFEDHLRAMLARTLIGD